MTSFGTFFRELFKEKSKSTYLVYLIQLAAAVVTVFLLMFNEHLSYVDTTMAGVKVNNFVAFIDSMIVTFLVFSVFAEPIYLLMTSWYNEKINRSQTWRLVPMSDTKIYLCNTLSSFASYIYLGILQLLTALIGAILTYICSSNVRKGIPQMFRDFAEHNANANWGQFWLFMFEFFVLAILIGLFWYVVVSFYHFTYRAIIDFLPQSNKFILFLIRAAVLIIVIILVYQVIAKFSQLFDVLDISNEAMLGTAILEFFIFDLLFGGLNLWLIDKFVEAKQN